MSIWTEAWSLAVINLLVAELKRWLERFLSLRMSLPLSGDVEIDSNTFSILHCVEDEGAKREGRKAAET